jgi:hypothetical protein
MPIQPSSHTRSKVNCSQKTYVICVVDMQAEKWPTNWIHMCDKKISGSWRNNKGKTWIFCGILNKHVLPLFCGGLPINKSIFYRFIAHFMDSQQIPKNWYFRIKYVVEKYKLLVTSNVRDSWSNCTQYRWGPLSQRYFVLFYQFFCKKVPSSLREKRLEMQPKVDFFECGILDGLRSTVLQSVKSKTSR